MLLQGMLLADMTIVLTIEHFLEFILAASPTTDLIDNGKRDMSQARGHVE